MCRFLFMIKHTTEFPAMFTEMSVKSTAFMAMLVTDSLMLVWNLVKRFKVNKKALRMYSKSDENVEQVRAKYVKSRQINIPTKSWWEFIQAGTTFATHWRDMEYPG